MFLSLPSAFSHFSVVYDSPVHACYFISAVETHFCLLLAAVCSYGIVEKGLISKAMFIIKCSTKNKVNITVDSFVILPFTINIRK